MGKKKLYTGVIIGALVGGLAALLDKETRSYTKEKLADVKEQSSYCLKNPSEAVKNLQDSFDQFNQKFMYQTDNAVKAIEQVEDTLDKVLKKKGN